MPCRVISPSRMINRWLTNLFPLWVLGFGVLALIHPPLFTWFDGSWIVWGLAVIMLGMGLTLTFADFRRVLSMPWPIFVGLLLQFSVMPLLGWSIATGLALESAFAVGLILVSCCPGGTASNIVTYIARANVALSVLMTMCSTFAAVMMTPLLTQWLAGALVPVDFWPMVWSTFRVVVIPVLVGMVLHQLLPRQVERVQGIAPVVSVFTVALICASIVGQNAKTLIEHAGILLLAVILLHCGGFSLGYLISRLLGYERLTAQTVSIEVGMQNSGLGAVLARGHFADPSTAVPSALSSVIHSVIGSLCAVWWRFRKEEYAKESVLKN